MDAVKSFNNDLSGLYEVKPPISKAKMTSLTRGAIKAIKFYKHVVQSVEKFILKCKPEYKVPGLYVIDSIVRQSRHQFGAERDVFAPRFSKNMQQTFVNLFKCPAEDKSKVIRVLNLWQKNQVFPPEVIQPLFDLTDPNHPMYKDQLNAAQSNGLSIPNATGNTKGSPALQRTPKGSSQVTHQSDAHGITNNPGVPPNQTTLAQLQQFHKLLQKQGGDVSKEGPPVRFDRKLLDFDYDDDEDDDHVNPSPKLPPNNSSAIETVGSLLSNPEVLRQLQTLQQTMTQAQHQEMDLETLRKLQEMKQQEEEFDKHLAQTVPNLPFASECDFKPPVNNTPAVLQNYYMSGVHDMSIPPPGYKQSMNFEIPSQEEVTMDSEIQYMGGNDSGDMDVITLDHADSVSQSPDERYANRRRRSRSRDRSRERVRDRDRRSRRSRSRSRSRDRRRRSRSRERDREREREKEKEKEKEKERKKRGLPAIKKDNMSVCSTTLWVGHLSKLVHQEELSDTFGEFGDVVSIDLIPPRGCAFICMNRRQDAARCLQKLKSHKMQGKAITLAWAPGKGVKGKDLKDYWEVEAGVSYVPWSKIKQDLDVELLEEGGMIDEDTMPAWLKAKQQQQIPKLIPPPQPPAIPTELVQIVSTAPAPTVTTNIDTSQPPPMPGGGLLQPPLSLPIMSPFQLNNRLLGVGMNIPHGMMPNVPIGVPPPNLSSAMMANQLLGMGSPFTQGPPGLLPPPLMPTPDKIPTSLADSMNSRADSLLGMPFSMMTQPSIQVSLQHEDNMDVEMEDVTIERNEKPPPLSEQLLASLGQHNNDSTSSNRLQRPPLLDNNNGRDRRDDRDSRSHDRERDKDRDRRGGRRNSSRDRNKDRDRDSRDRRDDRREKSNRWGDRDHSDREDQGERKDRNEKTLNERLREMAHQGSYSNRDRREPSLENPDFNRLDGPPSDRRPDRPAFHPPNFNNSDNSLDDRMNHEDRFRHGPPHGEFEPPPPRMRQRSDNWEEPEFEPPPPLLGRNDGPIRPLFGRDDGRPPRHQFNRPDNGPHRPPLLEHEEMFMEDRFRRNDIDDDFIDEPIMHDDFEPPPLRGPGFGPSGMGGPGPGMGGPGPGMGGPGPGIGGPGPGMGGPPGMGFGPGMGPRPLNMGPRLGMGPGIRMGPGPRPGMGIRPDFWGPPRPMRFHGPDGFHPRGRLPPPLHNFLPRGGPNMRGPRPLGLPWKDGGMRHNFQPRFDGPPDFQGASDYQGPPDFQGPLDFQGPPGPPGIFDENPHRKGDDRREFSQEFPNEEEQGNSRDRRTRWGSSPQVEEESFNDNNEIGGDGEEGTGDVPHNHENENNEGTCEEVNNIEPVVEQPVDGNSTPLHDEPQEGDKGASEQVAEGEVETEAATDV